MKLGISLPTEKGTFGAWITESDHDVHIYTHNMTHEGSGVVIGCNPTHTNLKGTDPALVLPKEGNPSIQYFDDKGEIQHRDIGIQVVHDAILAMLMDLKNKVK